MTHEDLCLLLIIRAVSRRNTGDQLFTLEIRSRKGSSQSLTDVSVTMTGTLPACVSIILIGIVHTVVSPNLCISVKRMFFLASSIRIQIDLNLRGYIMGIGVRANFSHGGREALWPSLSEKYFASARKTAYLTIMTKISK